jgi:hypothetical protein
MQTRHHPGLYIGEFGFYLSDLSAISYTIRYYLVGFPLGKQDTKRIENFVGIGVLFWLLCMEWIFHI